KKIRLTLQDGNGKLYKKTVRKEEYEDLGLEFETYLMDKKQHCKNKCIFCFIDQLPKGMRETLYFKDDDARLSFLFGNYITLTNIDRHDVDRMIEMHISPVNISVHTMNPELRREMMKNPNAGENLKFIEDIAAAGLNINAQLVLCPGINDGDELRYSIEKLMSYYPAVQSIAAVPVGITKFREGLCNLKPYDEKTAGETIDIIEEYSSKYLEHIGRRIVYAADEFYLKAGRPLPDAEFYEDFAQIENGVGMWADMKSQVESALETERKNVEKRKVYIATGFAAYGLMQYIKEKVEEKYPQVDVEIIRISNDFFGSSITVSGLITGEDLLKNLKNVEKGSDVLISSNMLRSEGDMFLDSMTLEEAIEKTGLNIIPNDQDGEQLLKNILGIKE
ncbi:MAG: DUF512 domain-containing protein, partial [Clostridia bacterium]|nr:DUF512 domain-containing protein [Clostridia bacterium]